MTLLNRIPEQFGGTEGKLAFFSPNGSCRDELYQAILKFQKSINMQHPDGVVEPGGITMTYLNHVADAHLPPKKYLTDWTKISKANEMYQDARIDAVRERIDNNAPEYLRAKKQEKEADLKKWHAWKEAIRRDGHGNRNAQDAINYLNRIEQKGEVNTEVPFLGEAIGFGGAWVRYGKTGDWSIDLMYEKVLLNSYDSRFLYMNTNGLDRSFPVILLSNMTHFVMKKNQTIEIYQHNVKVW
jgi:hypothetical protein